jgi:NADPH2:quinone reductase
MRAIVLDRFGGPDVLQLRDLADPAPGPGEVLVRVRAAAVNPVDTKVRRYGERYGLAPPITPGYDAAGTVEAVGAGVTGFGAGDAVFYTPPLTARGTYAELHVAPADGVVRKPDALSFEEAAAIPLVACTAWQALVERAGLRPTETVLIHGGGGVGHVAVQIAKAAGALVVVSASAAMRDELETLGADRVVDYRTEDPAAAVHEATGGRGADVVLDTVGRDTLERSIPAIAPRARLVTIVGDAAGAFGNAYQQNATLHLVMMHRRRATMEAVARLVERGRLRALVADVLPLERAAEAHRRIEAGGVNGKLVLTP